MMIWENCTQCLDFAEKVNRAIAEGRVTEVEALEDLKQFHREHTYEED